MKVFRFVLLFGFASGVHAAGLAQTSALLQGTVHTTDNQAIPFANVVLYRSADSTQVKGTTSDLEGAFQLTNIAHGNYYVVVSMIGFIKWIRPVTVSESERTKVVDVILQEEATSLQAVEILAQRSAITQQAGNVKVDVGRSILSSGQSLAETLTRVPGVTVDKDAKVSLKGRDGVMIMIDDKPLYMDAEQIGSLLKSIPADQVKEIEVITSPSAKYDAAGNAGIINIKLKKGAYEGFNGSATGSGGLGVYPKSNIGANASYKKGRWLLNGGYQYNYSKQLTRSFINRIYPSAAGDSSFYTSSDYAEPQQTHSALFSGQYEVSDKGSLSWDSNLLYERSQWLGSSDSYLYGPDDAPSLSFRTTDDSWGKLNNFNAGVGYKHRFDSAATELSAMVDVKTMSSNGRQNFETNYFESNGESVLPPFVYTSRSPMDLNQWSAKTDFTASLTKNLKMESGVKHNTISTSSQVTNTLTGDNHFTYTENIDAAYVLLNGVAGRWRMSAGLRLEHTRNKGVQHSIDSTFNRNYTNLFPSGNITFDATPHTSYTLLFTKRIDRPDYSNLNPFAFYSDPYTIFAGNPYLQPQYTYHTELTASLWDGIILATANYSYNKQPQYDVYFIDSEKLTTTYTTANLTSSVNYGISLSFNLPATRRWTTANYIYVYNDQLKGDVGHGPLSLSRVSLLINSTQTITLPLGISGELAFMYEAPHYWGTVLYREVWQLSAGIQKRFFRDKMGIKLSVNDIFWKHFYTGRGDFGGTRTQDSFKWDNRVAMLTLNYRFGKRIALAKEEESSPERIGSKRR